MHGKANTVNEFRRATQEGRSAWHCYAVWTSFQSAASLMNEVFSPCSGAEPRGEPLSWPPEFSTTEVHTPAFSRRFRKFLAVNAAELRFVDIIVAGRTVPKGDGFEVIPRLHCLIRLIRLFRIDACMRARRSVAVGPGAGRWAPTSRW